MSTYNSFLMKSRNFHPFTHKIYFENGTDSKYFNDSSDFYHFVTFKEGKPVVWPVWSFSNLVLSAVEQLFFSCFY